MVFVFHDFNTFAEEFSVTIVKQLLLINTKVLQRTQYPNSVKHQFYNLYNILLIMSNNLFTQLENFWKNVIQGDELHKNDNEDFIKQSILSRFALNKRIYFSIFNYLEFKKEFSTPNTLEVFGFPEEEHIEKGSNFLMSFFDSEHAQGVVDNREHLLMLLEEFKNEKDVLNYIYSYCGIKYNNRQKGPIRLLWKNVIFETNKTNQPVRGLSMFQDITNLMKNDFYWLRVEFKSSKRTFYMSYRSDTKELSKNDILSAREKEILSFIAEGKEAEEIAKILFLSKTTINNHRQNMLNKLGARDVTALIQLAKLTKLI